MPRCAHLGGAASVSTASTASRSLTECFTSSACPRRILIQRYSRRCECCAGSHQARGGPKRSPCSARARSSTPVTLDRTEYSMDTTAVIRCKPGQMWLGITVASGVLINMNYELLLSCTLARPRSRPSSSSSPPASRRCLSADCGCLSAACGCLPIVRHGLRSAALVGRQRLRA